MTTKTQRELVDQALANLGVLTPGQTATADDVATVDAYVGPLIEDLSVREIVTIQDTEEIEERYFLHLAVLLADACKYEFGGGAFDVVTAEQRLRRMGRAGPTYEVQTTEYF